MMAAYPMSAAAAAVVAAGGSCLPPSGAFCNLPWMCPSQPPASHPPSHSAAERLLQPSMPRRDGSGGHLEEIVVPGSSHHMMALHNSSVGPSPYFPLDSPSLMYSYYLGFGNADVRRKNATRESTSTLKAWLYEHRKNPYPTKGEKIMLAIITKMTLTQVSTWFANARRRLKKENKGEWGLKDTNDVDEDDFEDDVAHSEGGIANASASDTSSPRCSPDLPRLLSPSDDPLASRSVASAAGSASPTTNSDSAVRTSDDVKDEVYGDPSSISPPTGVIKDSSTSSSSSSSTSATSHSTPSSVPIASSHIVRHPTPASNLDRLAPPSGDTNKPEGLAGSVAPVKRKLWSIDDIVSPSHPTDASRSQGESSNPGPHPPSTSGFPLHCGPLIDRTLPYKYGSYFVDGTRFGRDGFEHRAPLYQWVTTKAGNGFEAEGAREVRKAFETSSNEFKEQTYRNGFFNRPPSLNVTGFTSENRHDYPTDVFKTENRNFKSEDDCHRTAS